MILNKDDRYTDLCGKASAQESMRLGDSITSYGKRFRGVFVTYNIEKRDSHIYH